MPAQELYLSIHQLMTEAFVKLLEFMEGFGICKIVIFQCRNEAFGSVKYLQA